MIILVSFATLFSFLNFIILGTTVQLGKPSQFCYLCSGNYPNGRFEITVTCSSKYVEHELLEVLRKQITILLNEKSRDCIEEDIHIWTVTNLTTINNRRN